MPTRSIALFAVAGFLLPAAARACWDSAAHRYGISPQLLFAIARVESNLDPAAINRTHFARTGTYDIGLMQINSAHLPRLRRFGIQESDLLDPCTNIHVGAWILADAFSRHGVTWNGVGAYSAACTQQKGTTCDAARSRYAWRVYRQLPTASSARIRGAHTVSDSAAGGESEFAPVLLSVRVAR